MLDNDCQFVICIENDDTDDLLVGKVYKTVPDGVAQKENYLRVIDNSGEDYLYPARFFVPITVSRQDAEKLSALYH